MRKIIIVILLLTFSSLSQAGFNGLTIHSRANCANNESISWDATHAWHLGTNSTHTFQNGTAHTFGSGIATTRRSAAVHWGEGTGGWVVNGEHYLFDDKSNKIIWIRYTSSTDCSGYDGWWNWSS